MTDKLFSTSKAAAYLNISRASLDRWQSKGVLQPVYTPGGHRRFLESDLRAALQLDQALAPRGGRRALVYARVSSPERAEAGHLQQQKERLVAHALGRGYHVAGVFAEAAWGPNGACPQLRQVLQQIVEGQADVLVIESRECLAFLDVEGLDTVVRVAGAHVEMAEGPGGPLHEEELLDELIAIVAFLGARLYGQRAQVIHQVGQMLREALPDGPEPVAGVRAGEPV